MVPMLVCCLLLLLVVVYVLVRMQWRRGPDELGEARLPPGSLGWPFIGETLHLYSQKPKIFKTHILGSPCIMFANPEATKYILSTRASLFRPKYTKTKEQLLGREALFFKQGSDHMRLRKLVQASLSLDNIQRLIPKIEAIAVSALDAWSSVSQVVHVFHELKKFTFEIAILSIFGKLDSKYKEKLKENYMILDKGYNSFSIKIPGTRYYTSLMARRRLGRILKEIINEAKEKRFTVQSLFEYMLNSADDNGKTLSDEEIADNVIGVLFAAQDTTAGLLTWILKYLTDNSKILEDIKDEQRGVFESNGQGRWPLTWAQTRRMPVTNKVILESLRMASIISFIYREATQDIVYDGFLIPKGWKVLPLLRSIHYNPDFFHDPETFDPSRFEDGALKPHTFFPFGYGAHSCPGNEVAKLEIFIFIYHLVNKYRWEVVGSCDGVEHNPFPIPTKLESSQVGHIKDGLSSS
ncbi:Abscisic acid 8'-hydroxylase 4-like protein [Drosera capensis]